MAINAYEMKYINALVEQSNIVCIPFEKKYFQEYMRIYNECFFDMRKALGIQPYNFLNAYKQIAEKVEDMENRFCYGACSVSGKKAGNLLCYMLPNGMKMLLCCTKKLDLRYHLR